MADEEECRWIVKRIDDLIEELWTAGVDPEHIADHLVEAAVSVVVAVTCVDNDTAIEALRMRMEGAGIVIPPDEPMTEQARALMHWEPEGEAN